MITKFKIFDKTIYWDSPCLIIAEIGINHMGDVNLCKDMILAALEAGADCVKLQTANADESYHPGTDSYKVFKGTELSLDEIIYLSDIAKNKDSNVQKMNITIVL